jgi:thiamine biosynthesis lipoprotein
LTDVRRDGNTLITQRPVVLDVGAVGKGYLVDIVSATLRKLGLSNFVVDAGGDLRHDGDGAIRVGLEHPDDPGLVIGTAELRDGALCASAVNRRAWGASLHHLIDARSGIPIDDVIATWVIAQDAALADGLATALFFTSADQLAARFQFAYVLIRADGRPERSSNFQGELLVVERP